MNLRLWAHFQEGGWMMYPVFALGLLSLGSAVRFALRGEHQLLGSVAWLLRTLLAAGGFGFLTELMRILSASQGPNDPMLAARVVMEGTTEAAHVPALALLFVTLACLALAVGQRRFPLPNPSAVAR